jgi:spore maturation protein CgeB
MKIVIIGLSITSSWGNGHATTYRALVRELARKGHEILFLERDVPWYAGQRDLLHFPHARVCLYDSLQELRSRFTQEIRSADAVIVGSYVPDGVAVGEWVVETARGIPAFYDIDTPVTLAKLARGDEEYLSRGLIPKYQLYLSFAGGKSLSLLEEHYGSPCARAFYCSVDPTIYQPDESAGEKWHMGYLGTYSTDRQPGLQRLMLEPAEEWPEGRFVVAGPQYPADIPWPPNVERIEHLPPAAHPGFYNGQRFTLNITRADMIAAGHSPSVRLFEAAACATPIISDWWQGLDELFAIGSEILVADSSSEALRIIRETPPGRAAAIGRAARARVLSAHTAAHRAAELENHLASLRAGAAA